MNRQAMKAYSEAIRMQREANWIRKARECSNRAKTVYAIIAGALALGGVAVALIG